MKLAIVTPLPPQHTGIADYASDLIGALIEKASFEITIISNVEINSIHNHKVNSYKDFTDEKYHDFDLILYQVGNNYDFHGYMLNLVKKFGGVIHLHDIVLHHLFAKMLWASNRTNEYYELIEGNYGPEKLNYIKKMIIERVLPWDSLEVINFPLFEEFVKYCDGCIIHSDFAKNKLTEILPLLDIYKTHQLYAMDVKSDKIIQNKVITFGIFGGVDPQKKVETIIKVFQKIKQKNCNQDFVLSIVGGITEETKSKLNLLITDELKECVNIVGRVNEEKFMEYFYNMDVLIALRYPSMGETSAVVMRAMQIGIPCIVNDIGWYSELPDHVIKVPIKNMEKELEKQILNQIFNFEKFNLIKKETMNYSKNSLYFDRSVEKYSNILKVIHNNQKNKCCYIQLNTVMEDLNYLDNSVVYTPVINKLADVFNIKN